MVEAIQRKQVVLKTADHLSTEALQIMAASANFVSSGYHDLRDHLHSENTYVFRRINIAGATISYLLQYHGVVKNYPLMYGLIAFCALNTALSYYKGRKQSITS